MRKDDSELPVVDIVEQAASTQAWSAHNSWKSAKETQGCLRKTEKQRKKNVELILPSTTKAGFDKIYYYFLSEAKVFCGETEECKAHTAIYV